MTGKNIKMEPHFEAGIALVNYTIENMMASSSLNTRLNLKEVAEKLDDTEYNPDNFPGVIWRPRTSYGVVIIMEDGRMMCTNVRSEKEVVDIFEKLTRIMEEKELITPRSVCPQCGAVVDADDVVCVECGFLLQS